MPDFGIGELGALFGGGDLLAGLFGGGEAAAAGLGAGEVAAAGLGAGGLETGLATIGAGAGGAAAGAGGGLADLVGTGAGLFGGTAGLEGTAIAGGAGADIGALLGGGGATALGTAEAFMGAPAASGLGSGAAGAPSAFGGVSSTGLSPNVANANASMGGGGSVFDTGTSAVPGVSAGGAPTAGGGASSIAAPAGVTAPVDPTALGGAAGAGSAAPTAGGATSSISDLLSKAGSGAMKSLTSNPLGIALGAGGLGYNILQGNKNTANQKALSADAAAATANSQQMVQSGEALQQYLASGTLPAGYQSQVDQAIAAAKTTAISNAASQGLSTDPTQNTALAAMLAKIDASKPAMQSQVASQLFASGSSLVGSGLQSAGLSGSLYQALVQNDTAAAANTGKAIATLAAALNGKSQANMGGITLSQG